MGQQALNSVMLIDADKVSRWRDNGTSLKVDTAAMLYVVEGTGEISVNFADYGIGQDDFVTMIQGSHVSFNRYSPDFRAYYLNFSSGFTRDLDLWKNTMHSLVTIVENPVVKISGDGNIKLIRDYCSLLHDIYSSGITYKQEVIKNMLEGAMFAVSGFYSDMFGAAEPAAGNGKNVKISRRHDIYKRFLELVARDYEFHRDVSHYAGQLCITPKHLGYVVKSASGKLASDTISEAVVMDAKSKLKSSNFTIGEISDSLNFPNPSFFCKYFKKHVGVTPKQYRDTAKG